MTSLNGILNLLKQSKKPHKTVCEFLEQSNPKTWKHYGIAFLKNTNKQ